VTDKHNTNDAFVNHHWLTKALLQFPADGSANKISSATRYVLEQKRNDASDSQMTPLARWAKAKSIPKCEEKWQVNSCVHEK
jgi:hypothetical protein